jgi:hypothetical protein
MKIEWNRVTWYSKLLAVVIFVGTFLLAFKLGMAYEAARAGTPWDVDNWHGEESTQPTGGTAGAHCGGFIKDAPTCAAGFHCQLTVSRPDTGGVCVAD